MPIMDLTNAKEIKYNSMDVIELYHGTKKLWTKPVASAPDVPKPSNGDGKLSLTGELLGYGWLGPNNPLGINERAIKGKVNNIQSIKTITMKGVKYKVTSVTPYYGVINVEVEPPVIDHYEYDEIVTITYDE